VIRIELEREVPGFSLRLGFDCPARGVTGIIGPSGAGKTTLLRCLAGLERSTRGRIEVAGQCWQDDARGIFLATHLRAVGYVFQEPTLFPHLNVRENLQFGLRRTPAGSQRIGWEQTIELLGIAPLLSRPTYGLSGGERQRIAMGRALLSSPQLLLMDEPLAALDIRSRREILPSLERLHRELDLPILYVSHQMEEIAQLADHLVVLQSGSLLATGPIENVLARLDLPCAQDEDACVVVRATFAAHEERYHLSRVVFAGGQIHVADARGSAGQPVRVRILARDVSLALSEQHDSSILNRFPATVVEIASSINPAYVMVRLQTAGVPLLARITLRSREDLGFALGDQLWAQVKSVALVR
jgi:molybdate transport system ATP-binding protein